MSFSDLNHFEIPLVETSPGSPVHDLLAAVRDPESDEMYRMLWGDFSEDLIPRLQALAEVQDPETMRRDLHAVRGMSAQFGLFVLEMLLFAWEVKTPNPVVERQRFLPTVLAIASRSMEDIEQAFPHLKRDCD